MYAIDQTISGCGGVSPAPISSDRRRQPLPSDRARCEMLGLPGEPFWLCDWTEVVFIHFEVDPATLQREVPFALDLFNGRAFVTLVAFTLTDLRPRLGGRLSRMLFKPFGTHRFLNVRTYVREREHTGIYFLAEWLNAPRLNLLAGPALYGLPFRYGRLNYQNRPVEGRVRGTVRADAGALAYSGTINDSTRPAVRGSLDEFLVERYRAFTCRGDRQGWFPRLAPAMENLRGLGATHRKLPAQPERKLASGRPFSYRPLVSRCRRRMDGLAPHSATNGQDLI